MVPSTRFRINSPDVIQESMDGEAVIVNLANGSYYSLDEAGTVVLTLIEAGARREEIVATIAKNYQGEAGVIAEAVEGLLRELHEEDLIVPIAETDPSGAAFAPDASESPAAGTSPVFPTPTLRKYTDMQQLLLMDPVHEVDASGWPNRIDSSPSEVERS